jgi:hypothetical protein
MRHIGTLIIAIVVAPLAWVLVALGQDRSVEAFAGADRGGALHADDFVRPLLFLTAAGLLLGILGTLRFSPLGAMVIGIVYTLSSTMLLVTPSGVLDLFTAELSVAGRHVDLAAPIRTGTTMVLGVLLLVGAISVQRWRRWPGPADMVPETAATPDRPLGTDGPGLTPPYPGAEPDLAVRHATDPEPYATALWPGATDDSTSRRATSPSNAPYGW